MRAAFPLLRIMITMIALYTNHSGLRGSDEGTRTKSRDITLCIMVFSG
jgi:hypothetical protein